MATQTPKDVLKFAKDNKVEAVDLKFLDLLGLWQHFTIPTSELTEELFEGVSGWLTYVSVDDCAKTTRKARELGAQVVRDCVEIPDGIFSVLRDPAGAAVGVFQPRKR